jgi:hypothetical protein
VRLTLTNNHNGNNFLLHSYLCPKYTAPKRQLRVQNSLLALHRNKGDATRVVANPPQKKSYPPCNPHLKKNDAERPLLENKELEFYDSSVTNNDCSGNKRHPNITKTTINT